MLMTGLLSWLRKKKRKRLKRKKMKPHSFENTLLNISYST
jgi:hypothetical protein